MNRELSDGASLGSAVNHQRSEPEAHYDSSGNLFILQDLAALHPHIAVTENENRRIRYCCAQRIRIELKKIANDLSRTDKTRPLVIEGAGGLMVPLNEQEFVIDLAKMLDARLVLVSRNYLGSINHSLMTAAICRNYGLDVVGWVFNDQYLNYEA